MSIHLAGGGGTARRVVLSCDVAGCPVQLEPPPIEAWRSDADARSWAREHATGWTTDPVRRTDYCVEHAGFSAAPATGVRPPRPTATVRDRDGNPVDRDDYAERLRAAFDEGQTTMVAARLLDELAGVYREESLGRLARDVSARLDHRG